MTFMKISLLLAPVLLAPLVFYFLRMLFPYFLQEGIKLFTAADLSGKDARKVGTDICMRCVIIFTLSWVTGYGCQLMEMNYLITVGFAVGGVFLAMMLTITLIKKKLTKKSWGDAALVGMITFAGGNLPLIVLIPLLMFLATLFAK